MRKGMKKGSRAGRVEQVYQLMTTLGRSTTVYEIAYLMHVEPSSYLRGIVHDLVARGDVVFYEAQHRPNAMKRLYKLASQDRAERVQQVLI